MKEAQSQKKVGTTHKPLNEQMIEKYGEEEGVKRYKIFISKQHDKKIGTTHKPLNEQMIDKYGEEIGRKKYEELKITNKYYNNKGENHPSWNTKYSSERIENARKSALKGFYTRLDKDKIELIHILINQNVSYSEITSKTITI